MTGLKVIVKSTYSAVPCKKKRTLDFWAAYEARWVLSLSADKIT